MLLCLNVASDGPLISGHLCGLESSSSHRASIHRGLPEGGGKVGVGASLELSEFKAGKVLWA